MTVATRPAATHQPAWQRFQSSLIAPTAAIGSLKDAQDHLYQRQYSHVYHQRLAMLGPRCWKAMKDVNAVTKVKRVLEIKEGLESVLVGTFVRESAGKEVHPDVSGIKDEDILYLEDESGRVQLETEEHFRFCTGLVAGVQGVLREDGVLVVTNVFPPSMAPASSTLPMAEDQEEPHVLLCSGMKFGGDGVSGVSRDMVLSFLQGQFGAEKAKLVSHMIVAGGILAPECRDKTTALRDASIWVNEVASTGLRVDVLPGEHDPTTANWPQRPFHSTLLSKLLPTVSRTPNPYAAHLAEQLVIAADGRNIRDLTKKVCTRDTEGSFHQISELDALRMSLEYCHICPTGPDSVPTVPHAETDPMVITEKPALYVCGGAVDFNTERVNDTRIVCVPDFATTGKMALVNMVTLKVEVLKFEE